MSLLDNIKFVFQIPLEWFRRVAYFCFNSYGGNLIKITRSKDGSASFDVDEKELLDFIGNRVDAVETVSPATDLTDGVTDDRTLVGNDTWGYGSSDASLLVVSRVDKGAGGVAKLFFRELHVAASGHVVGIGAECASVEVI